MKWYLFRQALVERGFSLIQTNFHGFFLKNP